MDLIKQSPKVSIIMGIYNCASTLERCIESILSQTFSDWELIICDDGSTDSTIEIAEDYAKNYPEKIILLINESNITLAPTLNRCLAIARGDYIARQDGDDYSAPQRLERQVNFLEKNKKYDLVGTAMVCFDEKGQYGIRDLICEPKPGNLLWGTTFCHATIMIKREVFEALGGYSEATSHRQVEDYELWFRFFSKGYIGYNLNEQLYYANEDRNAYSRKSFKRRLNEAGVMLEGYSLLKLPKRYCLMILKPVVIALLPKTVLKLFHRLRMNKVGK